MDYDADDDFEDRLVKAPDAAQGHLNPTHDSRIRKTDSGTGLAGLSRLEISFAERGVVNVDNTILLPGTPLGKTLSPTLEPIPLMAIATSTIPSGMPMATATPTTWATTKWRT